jgi:hypothetical protein
MRNIIKSPLRLLLYFISLISAFLLFAFRKVIFSAGIPEFGDLIFHINGILEKNKYFTTWNAYHSGDNALVQGFLVWFWPLAIIKDIKIFSSLFLVAPFLYVSSSSFWIVYKLITRHFTTQTRSVFIGALFAGLFSISNPWVACKVTHCVYLWNLGTMLWIFYFIDTIFYLRPKIIPAFKYGIFSSFAIFIGCPFFYSVVFCLFFVSFLLIFQFLLQRDEISPKLFFKISFVYIATTLIFTFLLMSYCFFPLLFGSLGKLYSSGPLWVPKMNFVEISGLWKNSNVLNALRLTSFWGIYQESYLNPTGLLKIAWNISTMLIPIMAFSVLIIIKRKIVVLLSIIATSIILLASAPHGLLRILFFNVFKSRSFFWLLKDPDKWVSFLVLCYTILIGFFVTFVAQKIKAFESARLTNRKFAFAILFFILSVIIII